MIINTEEFKKVCNIILNAVNKDSETLELETKGTLLTLSVTDKEYYLTVKFNLNQEEEFHATVKAALFLNLISSITTETIELYNRNNHLEVKSTGTYKIPLIYENTDLMVLPKISVDSPTVEMNIDSENLLSILNYNSKELAKIKRCGADIKPVQTLYYLDNEGCITFTDGACVNNFTLQQPVAVLLTNKIIKLFKLFKDKEVNFKLAYHQVTNNIVQTRICFETSDIILSAIVSCNDTNINSVPVKAIRNLANKMLDYTVVVYTDTLKAAINRLLLFASKGNADYVLGTFSFTDSELHITDENGNTETINIENGSTVDSSYEFKVMLMDVKLVLDNCSEQFISINFGDFNTNRNKGIVIVRGNIRNIIPERY